MNIKQFKELLKFMRGNTCPICKKGIISVRSYLEKDPDRLDIDVKCTVCPTETVYNYSIGLTKEN